MMRQLYTKQGFTLIEILVSVALFSMVMVVALGALLSMSVATRKAESINSAVNNLSAAIDSMSRVIRTGANYHCGSGGAPANPQDCATPQPSFSFLSYDGSEVTYCLSAAGPTNSCNTNTTCTGGSCVILRQVCLPDGTCGTFVPLTAPEVNVNFFGFYVKGSTVGDAVQPITTMIISGTVPVTATQSSTFNIQTSIAQRIFDL